MLGAVGAIELLDILRLRIENEQMCGHEELLFKLGGK
jgi:hypothetical protein